MNDRTLSLSCRPDLPVGLVLSGGGARGAFQVGVWEILRLGAEGLGGLPHVVSGTSAGSINGALIAAGLSPHEMLDFWLNLARKPPVTANRSFFRSLENALFRLAVAEPRRALHHRRRTTRIFASIAAKHLRPWRGSGLAAILEFFLTARFDSVSRLLEEIKTSHLFSTDAMKARLADAIGGWHLVDPKCRLAINTVEVRTGKVIRFVTHEPRKHAEADASHYRSCPISVEMILASASIPLLFSPVNVRGVELWDGGLLVNTPIAPTVALGANRIVPVLVTAGPNAPDLPLSLGVAVERLVDAFLENAYNTDRKLLLERNKVAEVAPARNLRVVSLYEAIRPTSCDAFDAGSYLYFEPDALLEMYEAGKKAAQLWLRRGPRLDTHPGNGNHH